MAGLSSVYLGTVGAFAFAAGLFALLHSRRPSAEHRIVAALSIVCAVATLALAEPLATPTELRVLQGHATLLGRLALLLAYGLVAQLALRTAPAHRAPRAVMANQIFLACVAALDVAGRFDARTLEVAGAFGGAAASGLLLASFARGYLAGRTELGGVIFGSGVLVVTVVHDGFATASIVSRGHLAPFGFSAIVCGLAARLAVEHTDTLRRLESRKRELRTRTRELQHSHHELKVAQAELGAKEQLAAVGELAAVVAHEVRNPLAILANAVSSLRKENLAADDRATLLEIIDSEATRLNRIVTDLLSFSRPITVQRASIDLGELVDRALSLATRRKEIAIDRNLAEGVRVWADGNLLRQVFDNLIANAMQAMEAGGTLTLRVHGTEPNRDGVVVEIIDTGEGMDTQVRRRAKDPFFTTRPSGTGLGLAIVDRIVEAHGGRLELDSRAGQGTKVTVHLPAASSEPPSSRPSHPEEDVVSKDASHV